MRGIRFRRGAAVVALAVSLTVAVGTGGCASRSSRPSASPDRQGDLAKGGPPKAGGAAEAKPGAPGQPAPLGPDTAAGDQRVVIYTGTITIRVSNVEDAARSAAALATGSGGLIGADQRTGDGGRSEAQLVLRVPSAHFSTVIDGIAKLGREESRHLSTEDASTKAVDLQARIATAQASVDRVRVLLAKAQSIAEIVSIESELTRREADLESLKAQKNKLDDLSALSTIIAVLLGPAATVAAPKPRTGFLVGLKGGWGAFVVSMQLLLTMLGALLPWLIVFGTPVLATLWLARRLRRRAARAVPHQPPPAPSPESDEAR